MIDMFLNCGNKTGDELEALKDDDFAFARYLVEAAPLPPVWVCDECHEEQEIGLDWPNGCGRKKSWRIRSVTAERWLASNDHDKFSEAMIECEHPAGLCGADGYCHYGGQCFGDAAARLNQVEYDIQKLKIELGRFIDVVESHPFLRRLRRYE